VSHVKLVENRVLMVSGAYKEPKSNALPEALLTLLLSKILCVKKVAARWYKRCS